MNVVVLAFVAAASLAACGHSATDSQSAVQLNVSGATESSDPQIGGAPQHAPANMRYWTVDMTLDNGARVPAPLLVTLFSLEDSSGLGFTADLATAGIANGCLQNATVSVGDSASCNVAFLLPADAVPQRLRYTAPDGSTASASVTITPCETCVAQSCAASCDPTGSACTMAAPQYACPTMIETMNEDCAAAVPVTTMIGNDTCILLELDCIC